MKNKLFYLVIIFSITTLTSCLKPKVEGNYHVVSINRNITSYNEIVSEGSYEVYYSYDTLCNVIIEAEENIIPYVETNIHGQSLVIKTSHSQRLETHFPIKVFVTSPSLSNVILSGSGSISVDSIKTCNLGINLKGSGNINVESYTQLIKATLSGSGNLCLSGRTSAGECNISGSGEINAYNIIQDTCFANISGSGSMNLQVIDYLNAHISGSGQIYYIGNPIINTHITGSGRIIHQ